MNFELTTKIDELNESNREGFDLYSNSGFAAQKINDAIEYLKGKITVSLDFLNEAQAKQYFGEALLFLDAISKKIQEYELHWQNENKEQDRYVKFTDFDFFQFCRLMLFCLFCFISYKNGSLEYSRIDYLGANTWELTKVVLEYIFLAILSVIPAHILSAIMAFIPYLIGASWHAKKVSLKVYENPEWFLSAKKNLSILTETLKVAEIESIEKIRNKKANESLRAEYEIKDEFGKKATDDKLRIIREELEAAIRLSKNHEEQHERTEEIRVKYAKEMTAIQKEAIQDNNKDLFDKLQVVQSIFGGQ
jgi:hypothetical protein